MFDNKLKGGGKLGREGWLALGRSRAELGNREHRLRWLLSPGSCGKMRTPDANESQVVLGNVEEEEGRKFMLC